MIHLPCTLRTKSNFSYSTTLHCSPPQYTHPYTHVRIGMKPQFPIHLLDCCGCDNHRANPFAPSPLTGFLPSLVGIQLSFFLTFKMVLPKVPFILFIFFSCLFCPFMVPDLLKPKVKSLHPQGQTQSSEHF